MSRPARRPLSLAAVAVSALLVSSCAWASPIQTQELYAPSDGVRIVLDEDEKLRIENFFVLTAEEGAPALPFGTLINDSGDDATVSISLGGTDAEVDVEAGTEVRLDEEMEPFTSEDAIPGATLEATVNYKGAVTRSVPVLDGTLEPYDQYLP